MKRIGWFFPYLATIFAILFSQAVSTEAIQSSATPPPTSSTKDERAIEQDREKAIFEAVQSVNPPAKKEETRNAVENQNAGVEIGQKDRIAQEVELLRLARKEQFKHLTWSQIKRTITLKTVAEKEEFLEARRKNLEAIISRAVSISVQADISKQRINLARFRIAKAIRDFFPETTFEADLKHGSLSIPAFVSDHWRTKFRIPVFRGGVLWNTLQLEMGNLEIAKRDYDKTVSNLIAAVSQAYFEYERAQNMLRDQEKLIEKVKEQKKISDEKYKAKLISEIEKLNTDSLFGQAQYDLETAEQEVEIAKLELQKFLNLETTDPINVSPLYSLDGLNVESLRKTPMIPGSAVDGKSSSDWEHLIELAYENRPDLQLESAKLKATQFAYRVSLGQRLPQFDLLVEVGELAESFISDSLHPKHRPEFRFGMEATWPFLGNTLKYAYDHDQHAKSVTQFQSGEGTRTLSHSFSAKILDDMGQFSSMLEAKISNLEQVVELEKTERDVVREVKEAYFNFKKALIQVESSYKRMGYRNRLAQLAKHRLDTNEIQISEYLQAEMDFTQERGLVYKALSELFLSKAKLNRAIGIRNYLPVEVLQ